MGLGWLAAAHPSSCKSGSCVRGKLCISKAKSKLFVSRTSDVEKVLCWFHCLLFSLSPLVAPLQRGMSRRGLSFLQIFGFVLFYLFMTALGKSNKCVGCCLNSFFSKIGEPAVAVAGMFEGRGLD